MFLSLIKKHKDTFYNIILPVYVYRVLLDISFYYFIISQTSYEKFYIELNYLKLIESYFFLFILTLLIPPLSKRVSVLITQLFLLMAYFPLQTFYAFSNQNRHWFYLVTLFWLIIVLSNRLKYTFAILPLKKNSFVTLLLFSGILSVASVVLMYLYMDVNLNFEFDNVYEIRKNYVGIHIPFAGYLFTWVSRVALPFIMLVSLFYRRSTISYLSLFVSILFSVILFSGTGNKIYIFCMVLGIMIASILKFENFFKNLILIFSVLIIVALLSLLLFDNGLIYSLLIRRTLFLPARLSYYYYDFFLNNPIYLSHSIFKSFIHYPYPLNPAFQIGDVYFNKPEMSANNGIVADGFMNFGFVGIFIWSIFLAGLLKLADIVSENKNPLIIKPLLIVSFFTLVDGALFTTLLTHGLILCLLIAYLFPASKSIHMSQ